MGNQPKTRKPRPPSKREHAAFEEALAKGVAGGTVTVREVDGERWVAVGAVERLWCFWRRALRAGAAP
jgi:hypothetical protein